LGFVHLRKSRSIEIIGWPFLLKQKDDFFF
jgi:hypothetical protein